MHDEDSTAPPPPLRIGLPSRLGEMLIRQGLVTSEEVQAALAEQAAGSEWRLGRILVRRGALDDRTLVQAIAHQFHVQVVDLRVEPPTPVALARLARSAAVQLQALPLRLDADALVVAVADPPVRELRVAVERCTGLPVRLVLAAADELAAALGHWYGEEVDVTDAAMTVADASVDGPADGPADAPADAPADVDADAVTAAAPDPVVPDDADETAPPVRPDAPDANDLQVVVWLLSETVHNGATAVHLDHGEDGLRIRYRVDGALVPGPSLPAASGTLVCHRLLAAARLDPVDDGLHEGAFDTVVDGRSLTCRVTALATAAGTHVVVRTEAATRPGRLEDLRIGAADAASVRAVLGEARGVMVVASSSEAAAADVCATLVDEAGPDDHVIVNATRTPAVPVRGAIAVDPDAVTTDGLVATARALGADVLLTDVDAPAARRAAFDAAAEILVVLRLAGEDPSDVVSGMVEEVGAFLVAGMLRMVLVVGDPPQARVDVHVVTEDVCRAILDLPRP